MTKLRAALLALTVALGLTVAVAAPVSAQSEGGSISCWADQAKLQVYAAGTITVAVNGRYIQSGFPGAPFYTRTFKSGVSKMNFFIYSAGPMSFVEYCGTWS